MSVAITSANTNKQIDGERVIVRTSSGTPYVIINDATAGRIEVWKGNSTNPTSFTEQDIGNAPQNTTDQGNVSPSVVIDDSDVIHIVFALKTVKDPTLRYITFDTSSDTFGSNTSILSETGQGTLPYTTAVAIDSNGYLHVAYHDIDSNMGTFYQSIYYVNNVGGSWNSSIEVEGAVAEKNGRYISIVVDGDNIPNIGYINLSDTTATLAVGDTNNATSFTLNDRDTSVSTTNGTQSTSLAIDSFGVIYFAFVDSDGTIEMYEGATQRDTGISGKTPSIFINNDNIYLFYEDANNDIAYKIWDGSSWSGAVVLQTGTYNSPITKWAFLIDNDSSGTLITKNTYYFDGSDSAASDPDNAWNNETNTDDGDTGTDATNTGGAGGSNTAEYIQIEGTNAPASGDNIFSVKARIHDGTNWSSYGLLSIPSGGWTWAKIQALEIRAWYNSIPDNTEFEVYIDGDAGGINLGGAGGTGGLISRIEIDVFVRAVSSEIDYTFAEASSGDIYWNSILLINTNESITITDIVTDIEIVSGEEPDRNIDVFDVVTITEDITITNTQLGGISVNDSITIADVITDISVFDGEIYSIDVFDNQVITENITTSGQLGDIVVNDSFSISEAVIMEMVGFINVNDSITISEDVSITQTQPDLNINKGSIWGVRIT